MARPARSAERRSVDWVTGAGAVAFILAAAMTLPALFAVHPPTDPAHNREFALGANTLSWLTIAKAYSRQQLHVICDNYGTHKHPRIKAWLAKNPGVTLHFTPTSGSWMNLVEVFFGIITRQAIRRGTFTSVTDLKAAIGTYIDAWNERCARFTWTKDADTILAKATPRSRRASTSR